MSSPAPAFPDTPVLCQGKGIEYKAFTRKPGALFLIATAEYDKTGWAMSFEKTDNSHFKLMQQRVTEFGHYGEIFYIASWSSGPILGAPTSVTIADSFGDHIVPVTAW